MILPDAYSESLFDDFGTSSNMDFYAATSIKPNLDIMQEYQ